MIRMIAAIDSKYGLANEEGIPWQGKLPTDVEYYHKKLKSGGAIIMGMGTYVQLSKPYPGGVNYVATKSLEPLRAGFEAVPDAREFLKPYMNSIDNHAWDIGGAMLFASTLDMADELYLTRIDKDFGCSKFFPKFEKGFEMISSTEPQLENKITFHFEVWKRK